MRDVGRLDDYQLLVDKLLEDAIARHGPDIVTENLVDNVIADAMPDIADRLHAELRRTAPKMLAEYRSFRRGFVTRNVKRWRGGFDLLEQLIVLSQETGEAISNSLGPKASVENDPLFEALISNHARAIQVAREVLVLMINGFPDGALGRWRTLHEIAVVSAFVAHAGRDTAERYLQHEHVTAYKRAESLMKHHQRANLDPFTSQEIEALKAMHDIVIERHGSAMRHDYGWASLALETNRPTFADLEASQGLDHWRPRYKWATINTHGAYRPPNSTLGSSESETSARLVGESNSGMTDPAHMTAISLCVATMPVIFIEPNIDRVVMATILTRLSREIGDVFQRLDQQTWEEELERRARARPSAEQ